MASSVAGCDTALVEHSVDLREAANPATEHPISDDVAAALDALADMPPLDREAMWR
jgi:hypothetical protein